MKLKSYVKMLVVFFIGLFMVDIFVGFSKKDEYGVKTNIEIPNKEVRLLGKPILKPADKTNSSLVKAIIKETEIPLDNEDRYIYFQVDLNADGKEKDVLVYLWGSNFSGTGGGTMMIFANENGQYKFISKTTLVRFPILIADTMTNGYYDIIVSNSGGGYPQKNTILKYENGAYSGNASMANEVNLKNINFLYKLTYEVTSESGFKLKWNIIPWIVK